MLVFVDFEHPDGHRREPHGERILAARTWITYRLEDLSGTHCHLVRYDRVDQGLLDALGASAIFVSGNSTAPDRYEPSALQPVHTILRESTLPMFGFCGGFQLIAQACDARVVPLAASPALDADPTIVTVDEGQPFEYGYHPVVLAPGAADHPLFDGLGSRPVFRHAHGLHVPRPPSGFATLASTSATPVQLAVHDDRRIVGTQFHPEYWTDEHPDGQILIANFLRWAELPIVGG